MIIIGIDTSCDDTSVGIVKDGYVILSNEIASQIEVHAKYKGVVPEIASRSHLNIIIPLINQAIKNAGIKISEIDAVAATNGPGLIGSLLVGLTCAKAMAWILEKPFYGIDHIYAHVYAAKMADPNLQYPHISLIASGGHTILFYVKSPTELELIGKTLDDAAGEAMDKAAALLGLGYPGGPAIEKEAEKTEKELDPPLPIPMKKSKGFDFSFSGLKTALARRIKDADLKPIEKAVYARAFQKVLVEHLIDKVKKAVAAFNSKALAIGGGVARNKYFRKRLSQELSGIHVSFPPPKLCTDNGAMVAGLAYIYAKTNPGENLEIFPYPKFKF